MVHRDGRRLRLGHLTTIDMSLALLLQTELQADVEAGYETFGLSAPGPYVDRVERLGVTHVAIPALTRSWDPRSDARATGQLASALRRLQLDVLHTHNPKTGVLGRLIGRALGIPVVVNTCHGLWTSQDQKPMVRSVVNLVEGCAAQVSHAELFQNAEDLATMRRFIPAQRARLVGNGVDLERFRPDPVARAEMRTHLGIKTDALVIGGAGRLVKEKGIAEFKTIAHALVNKATFVWAGPPDAAKADAVLANSAVVHFLGELADMNGYYNALDIFVLPSYREGFSRSAMEAAACGRAMVLSDIRGCREIGRNGVELLLAAKGDADKFVHAARTLIDDAALRDRLGEAAQRRAIKHFDQRDVAATSLATYVEVARRRGLLRAAPSKQLDVPQAERPIPNRRWR